MISLVSDVTYLFDFALRSGHMLLVVPILILLVSFSLAGNGSLSLPSFLHYFLDETSQLSIPMLFQSFILSSPPPPPPPIPHSAATFYLYINEGDHGGTVC